MDRAPEGLLPDLVPRWTGHSLRHGFAVAARQADKDVVKFPRHGALLPLPRYLDEADT